MFSSSYGEPHSTPGEDKSTSSDADTHDDKAHCSTCHGKKNTSDSNAAKELEALKAQVQDVALVCNAVGSGNLSQTITVTPVHGVAMKQLTDVVNNMVIRYRAGDVSSGLSQLNFFTSHPSGLGLWWLRLQECPWKQEVRENSEGKLMCLTSKAFGMTSFET